MAVPLDDAVAEGLLVLRAQLGARDAIERLVNRYDAMLGYYLARFVERGADRDDLRQEVWIAVVRKLHTLDEPGAFRGWLFQIARHRAISWLRRQRIEIALDDAGADGELAAEVDAGLEPDPSAAEAASVHAALAGLSPSHREMLSLRFIAELSYDQIAGVVGCPVGTVRSRIHYAKLALRRAMGRKKQDDER
jgi:RNA polymerase sigma-70 factor (ECF subfamily)